MSTTEQPEQTATIPELPEVDALPVVVRFASRGRHLTLERVHPRRQIEPSTGNAYWIDGIAYEFQEGILEVYPDQDVIADRFNRDTGQMEEQDAIEWMRGHDLYGTDRGFWELAPVAPDPAPLQSAILKLAVAAGNPATREEAELRLVTLYEQEADTWKRPVVLDAVKVALAAIESVLEVPEVELEEPAGAVVNETFVQPPRPHPEAIPVTQGPKPTNLDAGFNPDA